MGTCNSLTDCWSPGLPSRGSGDVGSTLLIVRCGVSLLIFLLGTLRDLVLVVMVACKISMRRCKALV